MQLDNIQLEWFRGAADPISLPIEGKSIVVYGPNGAGKSSFVDALEYLLCNGKIGHLSHEYSGKKQEKGVINTHRPGLKQTRVVIQFVDQSSVVVDVKANGSFSVAGNGGAHLAGLDYRRVVLRQDEVAEFIRCAKGEKYSALLPLLGLEELEFAAENTRQLAKRTAKIGDLEGKQRELAVKKEAAKGAFRSADDLERKIDALHAKYRGTIPREGNLANDCREIQASIRERVAALTPDVQRHAVLRSFAGIAVESLLRDLEASEAKLVASSISFLQERVAVLESATVLVSSDGASHVRCPACGTSIERAAFSGHLEAERQSLAHDKIILDQYQTAVEALVEGLAAAKRAGSHALVASWWKGRSADGESDIEWLVGVEPGAVRGSRGRGLRDSVERRLSPMIREAEMWTSPAFVDT